MTMCPDCKGSGRITLLFSVVPCETCFAQRTDTGTMLATIPLPHDWLQRAASGQPAVPAPLSGALEASCAS